MAKFSETMDPCFVGRNAAVMQYTQIAYTDGAMQRLRSLGDLKRMGETGSSAYDDERQG